MVRSEDNCSKENEIYEAPILEPIILNPDINHYQWDFIESTIEGVKNGQSPIRTKEGTGGAYFLNDSNGEEVSVFKPVDEEPNAENNPKDCPNGEGLKKGTRVGEGAIREVAAFILDHPMNGPRSDSSDEIGFSGVPPTTMVKCLHEEFDHPNGFSYSSEHVKVGSLQKFMRNDGSCHDFGPKYFPVQEVHKISVLDIRLANTDRHAGNILIRKDVDGKMQLIPIDHGYCLPSEFEDCTFDWLYWTQAREPYNSETVAYINSLDAEKDIELLSYHGWDIPVRYARTLRISTMLLKKGVERGLTPYEIGSLMCRENHEKKSVIEKIVCEAQDSLSPNDVEESAFLQSVSDIMDSVLDNLV